MATGNVYGHMKENNEALSDIPEWHITKNGQEPKNYVRQWVRRLIFREA